MYLVLVYKCGQKKLNNLYDQMSFRCYAPVQIGTSRHHIYCLCGSLLLAALYNRGGWDKHISGYSGHHIEEHGDACVRDIWLRAGIQRVFGLGYSSLTIGVEAGDEESKR